MLCFCFEIFEFFFVLLFLFFFCASFFRFSSACESFFSKTTPFCFLFPFLHFSLLLLLTRARNIAKGLTRGVEKMEDEVKERERKKERESSI